MDSWTTPSENSPSTIDVFERIKAAQEFIGESPRVAQEDAKKYANRKRLDHEFTVGAKVWLLRKNIKTKRPSDKLDHRRIGPFIILEQINPVCFKLKLPKSCRIQPVFHVSMLEKYCESEIRNRNMNNLHQSRLRTNLNKK